MYLFAPKHYFFQSITFGSVTNATEPYIHITLHMSVSNNGLK